MKKNKIILIVIILGLVAGFTTYNYVMKAPQTIEDRSVDFTGTVKEFVAEVRTNPLAWTNKVVEIKGRVTYRNSKSLTFISQVFCQYNKPEQLVPLNQQLKIKGRFIGYDDLMDELRLDQCIIIQN